MSESSKLQINKEMDKDSGALCFRLSGSIDVTAASVFDAVPSIDENSSVILDFAEVERINSMGLAQLMKLLELWQARNATIKVQNLNRMTRMLFKMTGMGRFFSGNGTDKKAPEATDRSKKKTTTASTDSRNIPSPRLRRIRRIAPARHNSNPVEQSGKLGFSVSLQSSQQLSGWYFFNTFLQRKLEIAIRMDIQQHRQKEVENLENNTLVFAKPFEACTLIRDHNFLPIARPAQDCDEVSVVVARSAEGEQLSDFGSARVVTAKESNVVYLLGRFLCDECGLDSSSLDYTFTGNEIKALQLLFNGDADVLLMLKKNYHELSKISRKETRLVEETDVGIAYHMLLVAPDQTELSEKIQKTLLNMDVDDETGKQVLKDLGIEAWSRPEQEEIDMLLNVFEKYHGD